MVLLSNFDGEACPSDSAAGPSTPSTVPHFVVLQHGVNGSPSDLALLRRCLEGSTSTDGAPHSAIGMNRFVVWDTPVNGGVRSYKGTEPCADAIMKELIPALDRFIVEAQATLSAVASSAEAATTIKPRFSVVGHSFGGLLVREVAFRVHQLYREVLHFCSFVSTAAPHLGVRMASHIVSKGGYILGHTFSQTIHELCLSDAKPVAHPILPRGAVSDDTVQFTGQLASRLVDADHIAALAAFDTRLLVANLTNDHLVPFQTSSLMVDAQYAHLKDLVANADRVTAHTLPLRKLAKFSSDAEARACIGAAHWNTAEGAITRSLRSALDFDMLPVAVSSRFMRAHPAVVSKWLPFQRQGMDDVSHYVAQYIARHGAVGQPALAADTPEEVAAEALPPANAVADADMVASPLLAEQSTVATS